MIPVDQVRVGVPFGQCTEACAASLLEVELDAIPDLYAGQAAGDPRPMRPWCRMLGFITSCGYMWTLFEFEAVDVNDFDLDDLDLPPLMRELARGHHLLGGDNPLGLPHMCVGRDGKVVHDPNPSRLGLATIEEIILFVPDAALKPEQEHWIMAVYDYRRGEWVARMEDDDD